MYWGGGGGYSGNSGDSGWRLRKERVALAEEAA